MAGQLAKLDENLAEAAQAHERAGNARKALVAFAEAGVEELHRAGRELQRWTGTEGTVEDILSDVRQVSRAVVEPGSGSWPPSGAPIATSWSCEWTTGATGGWTNSREDKG